MDLTPGLSKVIARYGGAIQAAAGNHLSTADVWQAIRDSAAAQGLETLGVSATDVSRARGIYGGMIRAADTLASAERDAPIDSSMIGQAPWSPPLDVQAAAPEWLATFKLSGIRDGEPVEEWHSVYLGSDLPETVGDLWDLLGDEADIMADHYHVAKASISAPQLTPISRG